MEFLLTASHSVSDHPCTLTALLLALLKIQPVWYKKWPTHIFLFLFTGQNLGFLLFLFFLLLGSFCIIFLVYFYGVNFQGRLFKSL